TPTVRKTPPSTSGRRRARRTRRRGSAAAKLGVEGRPGQAAQREDKPVHNLTALADEGEPPEFHASEQDHESSYRDQPHM
ncbi:hypothetical protein, partial [Streptomyces katrae]|uniref:hypothetical protein n=1 Tax=Streptomyces katrae TaxID=68223 RepID=UPI001B802D73